MTHDLIREGTLRHTGLDAHSATVLWTQLAVLLGLAHLLGAIAKRLGQPPIVGSLLAGLVAGPSVFGQVWPAGFHWFLPGGDIHSGALNAIAGLSLLILLIALGAETDIPLIRTLGRPAGWVIAGSIVLPGAAGVAIAYVLPGDLLGTHHQRLAFALLIAGAMSVSSLPVVARIITELDMTRRNVGQLTVAAATANDGYGFLLLAVVLALVGGHASDLVKALVGLVVLSALVATVGRRAVDAALRRTRRDGPNPGGAIAIALVTTLGLAAVSQALGLDAALGAFIAGIVLGGSRFIQPRAMTSIEWMSSAFFAPLYFATAGLSVDVTKLSKVTTAEAFGAVLVVALAMKFAGSVVGATFAQLPRREGIALGIGLNGRGAMQVILGAAGLTAGLLSSSAYTIVILMSIISSVLVPPLLRRTLRSWEGTEEEQRRLREEKELSTNVVVRGQRLLLPSRGSRNSFTAARILDLAWPPTSEVTVLSIGGNGDGSGPDLSTAHDLLASRETSEQRVDSEHAVDAILAEANLGYGVIALGADDRPRGGRFLSPVIEELANRSPIPLLIVKRGRHVAADDEERPILRPRHLLVPVTGNAPSRAGQEVAHQISRNTGADVTLVHVSTRPDTPKDSSRDAAGDVLDQAETTSTRQSIEPGTVLLRGQSAGEEVLRYAQSSKADLIIVGATVRRVAGRPFLGHTVEHLLEHGTDATVVVVALPDAQQASGVEEHVDRTEA
jgi:Kef-type K+ transport system membrane component KefB